MTLYRPALRALAEFQAAGWVEMSALVGFLALTLPLFLETFAERGLRKARNRCVCVSQTDDAHVDLSAHTSTRVLLVASS